MAEPKAPETVANVAWGRYSVPALEGVRGEIQFESTAGRVYMQIDDGTVAISPGGGKPDTVLRTDIPGELLRLVRGEINVVTALLQGRIEAEGDLMLMLKVAGTMPDIGRQQGSAGQPTTQAGRA